MLHFYPFFSWTTFIYCRLLRPKPLVLIFFLLLIKILPSVRLSIRVFVDPFFLIASLA